MPLYESVFIARQDIPPQEVENLTEIFSGILTENGGSLVKHEYWGLKSLAYRIKKNRKGHYVMCHIDAPSEAVHEMERNMRLHEDILRYLTTRVEALEEGPSAMLQGRGQRDERPRRGRSDRGDRDRSERPPRDGDGEAAPSSGESAPAG